MNMSHNSQAEGTSALLPFNITCYSFIAAYLLCHETVGTDTFVITVIWSHSTLYIHTSDNIAH